MIDSETKSLWSQLLGKAMRGPLKGTELKTLPALMTDWKTWRTRHPDTTVLRLSRTSRAFQNRIYQHPKQFVLGVAQGGEARHWSFAQLVKHPVVNDHFRKIPLVVAYEKTSGTAYLYDRRVEGRTLTFQEGTDKRSPKLIDQETQSVWDVTSGVAVEGPLAGKTLALVPAIVSFERAWRVFHPASRSGSGASL